MATMTSTPSAPTGERAATAMARTSSAGNSPPSGFTLIELMVVLLVLAAAVAFALPRLESAMPGLKLRQTARELVVMLRAAQRQAIGSGRDVAVELDLPHGAARGAHLAPVMLDRRFDVALTAAAMVGER